MPHILYAYHAHRDKSSGYETLCVYWCRYATDRDQTVPIMDIALAQARFMNRLTPTTLVGPVDYDGQSCSYLKKIGRSNAHEEGTYTMARNKPAPEPEVETPNIYHVHTNDEPYCRSYMKGDTAVRAEVASRKFGGTVVGPVDFGADECSFKDDMENGVQDSEDGDEEEESPDELDDGSDDLEEVDEDEESDEPDDESDTDTDEEEEDTIAVDEEEYDDSTPFDEDDLPEPVMEDESEEPELEYDEEEESEEPNELEQELIFDEEEPDEEEEVVQEVSTRLKKGKSKAQQNADDRATEAAVAPKRGRKSAPVEAPVQATAPKRAKGNSAGATLAPVATDAKPAKAPKPAPTPLAPVTVVSTANIKAAQEVDLHELQCSACNSSLDGHKCPSQRRLTGARKAVSERPQCPHCGGRIHFNLGAALVNAECLFRQFYVSSGKMDDPNSRLPVFTLDTIGDMNKWKRRQEQDGVEIRYGTMETAGGAATGSWAGLRASQKPEKEEAAPGTRVEDVAAAVAVAPKSREKKAPVAVSPLSTKKVLAPKAAPVVAASVPTKTEDRAERRKKLLKGKK